MILHQSSYNKKYFTSQNIQFIILLGEDFDCKCSAWEIMMTKLPSLQMVSETMHINTFEIKSTNCWLDLYNVMKNYLRISIEAERGHHSMTMQWGCVYYICTTY